MLTETLIAAEHVPTPDSPPQLVTIMTDGDDETNMDAAIDRRYATDWISATDGPVARRRRQIAETSDEIDMDERDEIDMDEHLEESDRQSADAWEIDVPPPISPQSEPAADEATVDEIAEEPLTASVTWAEVAPVETQTAVVSVGGAEFPPALEWITNGRELTARWMTLEHGTSLIRYLYTELVSANSSIPDSADRNLSDNVLRVHLVFTGVLFHGVLELFERLSPEEARSSIGEDIVNHLVLLLCFVQFASSRTFHTTILTSELRSFSEMLVTHQLYNNDATSSTRYRDHHRVSTLLETLYRRPETLTTALLQIPIPAEESVRVDAVARRLLGPWIMLAGRRCIDELVADNPVHLQDELRRIQDPAAGICLDQVKVTSDAQRNMATFFGASPSVI